MTQPRTPPKAHTGTPAWQPLGGLGPGDLADTRKALHQASHVVQSLGRSILIHRDDDSHATMAWHHELGGLSSQAVNGRRLVLRFAAFELAFIDADDRIVHRLALGGRSVDDASNWLRDLIGRNASAHTLDVPYDLPDFFGPDDEPFPDHDPAAGAELARWYADADLLLSGVVAREADASPLRAWPHHFDLATLLTTNAPPAEVRTLGIGMTPGDDHYAEPYLYVSPWPFPPNIELLPDLPCRGFWHADGWVGAVLLGRDIVAASDQLATCQSFVDAALRAGRDYLKALP